MKKITALAALLAIPALAAPAGYFQVPGTDTTLKLYGFAETWAYYNMNTITDGDMAASTPIGDESNQVKNTTDSWTAGRIGITSTTPSAYGDVNVKVEFETKSTASQNSWSTPIRLRHAYGEFAGLLIGQTNSLFVDWQYCPAYNDTFHPDFNGAQYRTRQIRYTFHPTKEIKVALAMEQNKTAGSTTKLGNELIGSFNYSDNWGFVTATVGYMKQDDDTAVPGGADISGTGTSFNLGGAWNITDKDQVGIRVIKGGGQMGSSVYGLPDGFYTNAAGTGYDFYKSTSIDLGYSHTWNDQFTTNLGVGQIKFGKDAAAGLDNDYKVTEFFINTNWNVTKNVTFGVEYFDSSLKVSNGTDNNTIVKNDGTFTDKAHQNGFNLWFHYNFF